jgi:hypothetical protein
MKQNNLNQLISRNLNLNNKDNNQRRLLLCQNKVTVK